MAKSKDARLEQERRFQRRYEHQSQLVKIDVEHSKGHAVFEFSKADGGAHSGKPIQGVEHIADFDKNHGVLDMHELFHDLKGSHADLVSVVDTAKGSEVYAQLGGKIVEVAILDNVHHTTADLLKSGLLLA